MTLLPAIAKLLDDRGAAQFRGVRETDYTMTAETAMRNSVLNPGFLILNEADALVFTRAEMTNSWTASGPELLKAQTPSQITFLVGGGMTHQGGSSNSTTSGQYKVHAINVDAITTVTKNEGPFQDFVVWLLKASSLANRVWDRRSKRQFKREGVSDGVGPDLIVTTPADLQEVDYPPITIIVGFVEFKKPTGPLAGEARTQARNYALIAFELDKLRQKFFVYLYSGNAGLLLGFSRHAPEVIYVVRTVSTAVDAWRLLVSFAQADPALLGFNHSVLGDLKLAPYCPQVLGEGTSSVVYSYKPLPASSDPVTQVVKVYKDHRDSAQIEAENEVELLGVISKATSPIGERLACVPTVVNRLEVEGRLRAVVLSPLGSHKCKESEGITVDMILALVDLLFVIHGRGIVHRDIRPSNILVAVVGGTRRLVLTDFATAKRSTEGGLDYVGTVSTASDKVLTALAGDQIPDVTPADDRVSLLRTVALLICKDLRSKVPSGSDVAQRATDCLTLWSETVKTVMSFDLFERATEIALGEDCTLEALASAITTAWPTYVSSVDSW